MNDAWIPFFFNHTMKEEDNRWSWTIHAVQLDAPPRPPILLHVFSFSKYKQEQGSEQ